MGHIIMGFSKAIEEMIPIIDPEDDYLTIAAAEEQMALTHGARQKELGEAHAKLRRECPVCSRSARRENDHGALRYNTNVLFLALARPKNLPKCWRRHAFLPPDHLRSLRRRSTSLM